jgi:hypothetical protein
LQHYPLQSGRRRNGLIKVALNNATSSASVTLTIRYLRANDSIFVLFLTIDRDEKTA